MAKHIQIVAQMAMDQYYQNYRSGTDFFTLSDFIFHCGASVSAAFMQGYEQERLLLRADAREEVVSFSHDWLLEQILPVQFERHETFIKLNDRPISFPYDTTDCGIQEVMSIEPYGVDLERSNITEVWQQKFYPPTNKIFWWPVSDKIQFFNKGGCNIHKIRVLYAPAISDNMFIPDGLVDIALVNAVSKMKQLAAGVIVKKSLDQNDNKTLETEVDRAQLKG